MGEERKRTRGMVEEGEEIVQLKRARESSAAPKGADGMLRGPAKDLTPQQQEEAELMLNLMEMGPRGSPYEQQQAKAKDDQAGGERGSCIVPVEGFDRTLGADDLDDS